MKTASKRPWLRPLILVVSIVTAVVVVKMTGLDQHIDRDTLSTFLREQGAVGLVVFLLAFSVGLIVQLPGLLFFAAAVLAYGAYTGGFIAFFGGLIAFTASFFFARAVGGKAALDQLKHPWAKRALSAVESRPVRTVALLRVLTLFSPPTTYALALSSVRYRDFLVGSALGLLPVVVVFSALSECALMS